MMSAYQMTSDLETLTFDDSKRTIPQVEELTKNILYSKLYLNVTFFNIVYYSTVILRFTLLLTQNKYT